MISIGQTVLPCKSLVNTMKADGVTAVSIFVASVFIISSFRILYIVVFDGSGIFFIHFQKFVDQVLSVCVRELVSIKVLKLKIC